MPIIYGVAKSENGSTG